LGNFTSFLRSFRCNDVLIDEKLIFIKTKASKWEQNHKSNSDEMMTASISLKRKKSFKEFTLRARS
jgi:hypothetical protein